MIDFHQASYFISASSINGCPPDDAHEVAFVGRSNAGKSSAINTLTGQRKLARTSKTPGRTQLLNYFQVAPGCYIVDLPGFGYARVPPAMKEKWKKELERYLKERLSLKGLVLLMDIRHPFKDTDKQMIKWSLGAQLPLHILLTKADKLTHGASRNALLKCQQSLKPHNKLVSIQLFSALKNDGAKELETKLQEWLAPKIV
jgi:GTP-binding protein